MNQELSRAKTRVDQIGTLRENTGIIKSHCFLSSGKIFRVYSKNKRVVLVAPSILTPE